MFKVGDLVEVIVGRHWAEENGYSNLAIITKLEEIHPRRAPFLHLVHTDGRTSRVSAAIVKRLTKWH